MMTTFVLVSLASKKLDSQKPQCMLSNCFLHEKFEAIYCILQERFENQHGGGGVVGRDRKISAN